MHLKVAYMASCTAGLKAKDMMHHTVKMLMYSVWSLFLSELCFLIHYGQRGG